MDGKVICMMNWIKVRKSCTVCQPHSLVCVQLIPVARQVKMTGDKVSGKVSVKVFETWQKFVGMVGVLWVGVG